MKVFYRKNKLERQCSSAAEIKRAFGDRAKKVSMRLDEMQSSDNLAILMKLPYANCHPLTADRKGEWAVDISGNFRIIFEIAHDPIPLKEDGTINHSLVTDISVIKIEDYH